MDYSTPLGRPLDYYACTSRFPDKPITALLSKRKTEITINFDIFEVFWKISGSSYGCLVTIINVLTEMDPRLACTSHLAAHLRALGIFSKVNCESLMDHFPASGKHY